MLLSQPHHLLDFAEVGWPPGQGEAEGRVQEHMQGGHWNRVCKLTGCNFQQQQKTRRGVPC